MDDGSDFLTQGDDPQVVAGLHAGFLQLIDDAAHQSDQHTLSLIALDQVNGFLGGGSLAQNDGNAGDIAGNQGNTQAADDGIGQMAVAGSGVGLRTIDVLQNFDELGAQSGGDAGHKGIVEPVLPGHQGLYHTQGLLQLAQGLNLHTGHAVVAGKAVGGAGEGNGMVFAVLCNGALDCGLGQAVNRIVAAKNSFKKCHGFSSYC